MIYNLFIFIALIAFLGKNSLRIYKNYETRNIFPNIYNLGENNTNDLTSFRKISLNNKGYYYQNVNVSGLCMYGKSPCTSYKINDIYYKEFYQYKIFYKKMDL